MSCLNQFSTNYFKQLYLNVRIYSATILKKSIFINDNTMIVNYLSIAAQILHEYYINVGYVNF